VGYFVGITLLLGGEELLADRAISNSLAEHKDSVITQFEAADVEVGAITDALAPSLFGENRVVVIKGIQDLAAEVSEELAEALEVEDENLDLLLWHKGGVKGKALLEKIKKLKPKTIPCDVIKKESEKADFIHSEFKRLGRKVTPAGAQALLNALGSDLREMTGAISQLATDVAGSKPIDEDDVEKFQQGRIETTGFDVADAALDGKREAALIALRHALQTGVDPVLITAALGGSLRALGKVSGASRGVSSFELASTLGLAPWQIDKARKQLNQWTPATLAGAVIAVAQADADIKGAAADPIHSLERAIISITSRK
jgi:DNA polymerase-3 subunit delta